MQNSGGRSCQKRLHSAEIERIGLEVPMKSFFWMLTVVLVIGGFFIPLLWVAALVIGLLAIGSSPSGKREDGNARTGGLMGGIWDAAVVSSKMKTCPSCAEKIMKRASVCKHCGRDVPDEKK